MTEELPEELQADDIQLLGVVGSTAYGLETEESDQDRLGLYQVPTRMVLGLEGHTSTDHTRVKKDPDSQLHELGKAVKLMLANNPTVSEMLWLAQYDVLTETGAELVALRQSFLCTAGVRNAFGGYAVQQARKLMARHEEGKKGFGDVPVNRIAKHGRHVLRLARSAQHALTTGELLVHVGNMREEMFAAGELAVSDPEEFQKLFESEKTKMDSMNSVLPDRPDREKVNAFLVNARLRAL